MPDTIRPRCPTHLTRLADLATDQWGLVTRRQAERAGIPRRTFDRLASGESLLERVARGVYRLSTAPVPDHIELRAAWLQLAPASPAWSRGPSQGVVSHRSAAALYGLGDLPADRHNFIVNTRKQTRRKDVRLHHQSLARVEWTTVAGMPTTLPSRIVSDLLYDHEDPEALGRIIADAIRKVFDHPAAFAEKLAPHATRFGFRRNDGLALLRWFLDLVDDPDGPSWIKEARSTLKPVDEAGTAGTEPAS
jgi:predicted transcriptional regulator of viral defense system